MDKHHKITEVLAAGWQVTQITCGKAQPRCTIGANSNSAFQLGDNVIDMDVNSDVTCTFTNKRTASPTGALQVNKRVINTFGVPTPATVPGLLHLHAVGPEQPVVFRFGGEQTARRCRASRRNSQCKVS